LLEWSKFDAGISRFLRREIAQRRVPRSPLARFGRASALQDRQVVQGLFSARSQNLTPVAGLLREASSRPDTTPAQRGFDGDRLMFIESLVLQLKGAVRLPRTASALTLPLPRALRHAPARLIARMGRRIARAALRLAHFGAPLTPVGYVLVFVTLAAMLLVAMLSTSPLSNELGRSDRLSWWFS
jgi:hypothetical protein